MLVSERIAKTMDYRCEDRKEGGELRGDMGVVR